MSKKFGKMKPEIKRKFLDALTSGKYKKTEGSLKEALWDDQGGDKMVNCFCAGGVIMDLYAKEKKKSWNVLFPDYEEEPDKIPNKVLAWAGLPEVNNIHFTRHSSIMYVNDRVYKGVDGYEKVVEYVEKYL